MDSLRVSAAPLHDDEDDSGTFVRLGRAKTIARPALPNLFDRACSASSMSNRQIAALLSVNESSVRKMRDGRLAPKAEHWEALPTEARAYVSAALRPDVDPHHAKVVAKVGELVELLKMRRNP